VPYKASIHPKKKKNCNKWEIVLPSFTIKRKGLIKLSG
jgi:hypothetical protein